MGLFVRVDLSVGASNDKDESLSFAPSGLEISGEEALSDATEAKVIEWVRSTFRCGRQFVAENRHVLSPREI